MEFGYFTLSDNRYPDNPRAPEDFIKDIFAEALYAEKIGLNSAWIGEHHFNLLGVNASPLAILAQLAGATTKLRLAPAVTLLPVHHPLHVAEEWATLDLLSGGRVDFAAGRGYDRKEYEPFGAPFDDSAELFAEGLEIVWRAWTETGKWSHKGKFYEFKDVEVRPRPAQKPLRPYVACFSRPSMELAAQERLERDLRAVRRRHGLWLAGRRRARLSRDLRAAVQAADAARHVLLLRPHRLDARGGAVRQGSAGALFPGRADRGVSRRRRARRCRRPTSTSSTS